MGYRRFWRLLALPVLVVGLAMGQAANAFADMVVNQDIPYAGPNDNPCVPEAVLITSGVFHMTFHVTMSSSGNLHLDSMDNAADVQGIGMVSGASYTITDIIHDVTNIGPGSETTTMDDFHAISHGSTPNYVLRMTSHITFPAGSAAPTADKVTFETNCPPIT